MPLKRPTKIRSILDTLFSSRLISLQDLLRNKKIQVGYLSYLLEIELDFFEKYQTDINDFSGVIKLDNYRKLG